MLNPNDYVRERRPALTAAELASHVRRPGRHSAPITQGDAIAAVAKLWDRMDRNEAAGLWADCTELAADLRQSPALRRYALATANIAGHTAETGHADWSMSWEWARAAIALRKETACRPTIV